MTTLTGGTEKPYIVSFALTTSEEPVLALNIRGIVSQPTEATVGHRIDSGDTNGTYRIKKCELDLKPERGDGAVHAKTGKADRESYSGSVAQQSVDVQFVRCPHKDLSAGHCGNRKF